MVEASRQFTFRSSERTTLAIALTAACRGVECPAGEVCLDGACVPDAIPDAGVDAGGEDGGAPPDAGPDPSDSGTPPRFDAGPPTTCETTCQDCGGECVDVAIDERFCGTCAVSCRAGDTCVAGSCEACTADKTLCGGRCVSVESDFSHCGACGSPCAPDQICDGSSCMPAPIGARCALPVELAPGTYTLGESGTDLIWSKDLGKGREVPCLIGDDAKGAVAVRFVAPSAGTLTITLRTLDQGAPALEVFDDADLACECPQAGRCVYDLAEPGMVSLDVPVTAGQGLRFIASTTKERDAELILTLTP